jgi:FkbM family methyltransferase
VTWVYNHYAVTDSFNKSSPYGYFEVVAHETGKLIKEVKEEQKKNGRGYNLIALTTIDDYCSEHNISRVDVLKVDAEGGDLDVIKGDY